MSVALKPSIALSFNLFKAFFPTNSTFETTEILFSQWDTLKTSNLSPHLHSQAEILIKTICFPQQQQQQTTTTTKGIPSMSHHFSVKNK